MRSDLLAVILLAALVPADILAEDEKAEEDLKITASSDVWVSAGDGRENVSMSRTQILKLAGEKEMALIDFDCAKLTGRTIIRGELFVHQVLVEERFPQELVVSTVTNRWVEGRNSIQ